MKRWIIKVVINCLDGIREVHPPYDIDASVEVPKSIGKPQDQIQIKYLVFDDKYEAEYYFDQYEHFEEVRLIDENRHGNKITSIDQIEVNYN